MKKAFFAIVIAFSLLSCGNDDDSQQNGDPIENVGSFENDIIGDWLVSDVEITNSLITGNQDGGDIELYFTAEIINSENNTSISSYSSDPNVVIDDGTFDIRITSNIEFSIMGEVIENVSETTDNSIEAVEETSTWEIENDTITLSSENSNEVAIGQILELNENTLIISTPLEDFVDSIDIENTTGDVGNLVVTYTRTSN